MHDTMSSMSSSVKSHAERDLRQVRTRTEERKGQVLFYMWLDCTVAQTCDIECLAYRPSTQKSAQQKTGCEYEIRSRRRTWGEPSTKDIA